MMKPIPTDMIRRRPDARPINEASVLSLMDSIGSVGMINPIRVREKDGGWEVSAGSHRLAACERLGLVEIDCIVVDDDDLHAELSMIDENLCRNELSPAERAQQTARRKAIYEELHPETVEHVAGGKGNATADKLSAVPSFAASTASATGKDERTVRRDAERGTKVIGEVIDMITGTTLDTGTYLDKLKRLNPNEQVVAAKRDLAHERAKERERATGIARRIVKVADDPMSDDEVSERHYAALVAAWNKAGETARNRFRELIDASVMDARYSA